MRTNFSDPKTLLKNGLLSSTQQMTLSSKPVLAATLMIVRIARIATKEDCSKTQLKHHLHVGQPKIAMTMRTTRVKFLLPLIKNIDREIR